MMAIVAINRASDARSSRRLSERLQDQSRSEAAARWKVYTDTSEVDEDGSPLMVVQLRMISPSYNYRGSEWHSFDVARIVNDDVRNPGWNDQLSQALTRAGVLQSELNAVHVANFSES
jgi:hypothetical protein